MPSDDTKRLPASPITYARARNIAIISALWLIICLAAGGPWWFAVTPIFLLFYADGGGYRAVNEGAEAIIHLRHISSAVDRIDQRISDLESDLEQHNAELKIVRDDVEALRRRFG